jgi:zinc finger protein CreA/MIG
MARQMNNSAPSKRASASAHTAASSPPDPPSSPPPLSSPPALEQARVYNHHDTPPDSPPPLAHATLPATAHIPSNASRRSSSSPEGSYSPANTHLVALSSQGIGAGQNSQTYSYRNGATTYQEQSHDPGFTYVHTTPTSSSSSSASYSSSYSGSHNNFNNLPHINTSSPVLHSQHLQDSPNHSSTHSNRHSISHISPPSYPHSQSSSAGPPSPASSHSVSSHTSGPPTPSYVYHEDAHAYHHTNGMVSEPGIGNGHINSHGGLVHHSYSPAVVQSHHGRFDSPPPTLAPIQDERYIRREDSHSSHSYIHHPHSLSSDYQYHHHQPIGLGHGGWKPESGIRKSVASLVR